MKNSIKKTDNIYKKFIEKIFCFIEDKADKKVIKKADSKIGRNFEEISKELSI